MNTNVFTLYFSINYLMFIRHQQKDGSFRTTGFLYTVHGDKKLYL